MLTQGKQHCPKYDTRTMEDKLLLLNEFIDISGFQHLNSDNMLSFFSEPSWSMSLLVHVMLLHLVFNRRFCMYSNCGSSAEEKPTSMVSFRIMIMILCEPSPHPCQPNGGHPFSPPGQFPSKLLLEAKYQRNQIKLTYPDGAPWQTITTQILQILRYRLAKNLHIFSVIVSDQYVCSFSACSPTSKLLTILFSPSG